MSRPPRFAPRDRDTEFGIVSRRRFLFATAALGGGLLVQVSCQPQSSAQAAAPPTGDAAAEPTIFVHIATDDTISVSIPRSELGQGVRTTLSMLLAEELDADWSRVRAAPTSYDPRMGDQGTGGSGSVLDTNLRMRTAGAAMRMMLVAAAAKQFGVPASELRTEKSRVIHERSKRSVSYGALSTAAAKESIPQTVPLRKPADWRLLGTEQRSIDLGDILHGRATYGIDTRLDGMLFASIERASIFGATIKSFDASESLKVPGVRKVVEIKGDLRETGVHASVAVIATNTWAAMQGRKVLRIAWDPGPHAAENTASYRAFMQAAVEKGGAQVVNEIGDPNGMLAGATDIIRADYEVPFIAHATMEPQNCTARYANGTMELWSPTQFPDWATSAVAKRLRLEPKQVKLHVTPTIGGGFGRRINPDFSVEAALVARELNGVPVQVVWTREDDLRHDFYRPCALHRMEATLGSDGNPLAWRHRMSSAAIRGSAGQSGAFGADESEGVSNHVYRVANRTSEYTLLPSGVTRGWWRAVTSTHSAFAVECFIDELAARAGKDPYEYRMALIDRWVVSVPADSKNFPFNPERFKNVLRLAAEKAGWGRPLPAGHALGIATNVPDHLTYCAEVVEASVLEGRVKVHRVVVAVDCGRVVNPNGARAQIEGGVVQALSAALHERLTVDGGAIVEGNFDRYPLLRLPEAPVSIESHWVTNDDYRMTGLGEPSVPPLAPALANAIAKATGKRLRSLPLNLGART